MASGVMHVGPSHHFFPSTPNRHMTAIAFARYGPPDVLEPINWEPPPAGEGEVRIRMLAAGVAPVDAKLRAGLLQAHFQPPLPKIPGRDGVGVIEQIGAGVSGLKVGDAVCLMVDALGPGTYAQMVTCAAQRVVTRTEHERLGEQHHHAAAGEHEAEFARRQTIRAPLRRKSHFIDTHCRSRQCGQQKQHDDVAMARCRTRTGHH